MIKRETLISYTLSRHDVVKAILAWILCKEKDATICKYLMDDKTYTDLDFDIANGKYYLMVDGVVDDLTVRL